MISTLAKRRQLKDYGNEHFYSISFNLSELRNNKYDRDWERVVSFLSRLGSGIGNQIDNAVGVAEFVIVPWDQLDKVIVQLNTGIGVEDGAAGVSVEVWSGHLVWSKKSKKFTHRMRQQRPQCIQEHPSSWSRRHPWWPSWSRPLRRPWSSGRSNRRLIHLVLGHGRPYRWVCRSNLG